MAVVVPPVKVTDDADKGGIGRPDGKAHAPGSLLLGELRTHGAITFVLRAFGVEIQFKRRQGGRDERGGVTP